MHLLYKIPFGKHKGRTLGSLMVDNPKYLIWLSKQKWIKDELKEHIAKLMDDIIIDFGRHKDKTIGYVRINDPKYYSWLFNDN